MKALSNAEAALLGLLSEGPMYPYQIEKEVENRSMRFWTELSMSSIYKVLAVLETKKMATSRAKISPDNRTRKIYQLTAKGKKALREKLLAVLQEPEHITWQMDIAIANLALLTKKEILSSLQQYREALLKGITCYRDLEAYLVQCGCPGYRLALARRPVHLLAGELHWVDEYMKEIGGRRE